MYYTDQEKLKLVELISKSGLPIKKACKQYGISDASFTPGARSWRVMRRKSKSLPNRKPSTAIMLKR